MKTNIHLLSYVSQLSLERKTLQTNVVQKIKEQTSCSIHFLFFFENRPVYEIMWKIMVEPRKTQMRVLRMRPACLIPKATNTNSEYVTLIAHPTTTMVA